MKKILSMGLGVVLTLTLLLLGSSFSNSLPLASSGSNPLPMTYYRACGLVGHKCNCCGPCSGMSIGQYYREVKGYWNLPADCPICPLTLPYSCPCDYAPMYDALYAYMDTGIFGDTGPENYGPGFVEMALHYGYDDFSYVLDTEVTSSDYEDIKNAIDNGWPVALMAYYFEDDLGGNEAWPVNFHWVAIKGYGSYGLYPHVIICTDSATGDNDLLLNWDNLGTHLRTCIIKDVDEDTPDGPAVEDFEWGTDGASLEDWQGYGGEVDWEGNSPGGASVAEIDDDVVARTGTKSARFYRDGSHTVYARYKLMQPSYIGFWVRKDDTAYASIRNGDGNKYINVRINNAGKVEYTGSDNKYHTVPNAMVPPLFYWSLIEFTNIKWGAGTYDIWVNGYYKTTATMTPYSSYNGNLYFENRTGSGEFWIDDIVDSLRPLGG